MTNLRQMILETKPSITAHEVLDTVIYTKDLTVAENMKLSKNIEKMTVGDLAVQVMMLAFVDEDGERLFTQADNDALLAMPMELFKPLQEIAMMLYAGIKKDDIKKN